MLSVFLCSSRGQSSRGQLPVASCQLPVVSRQSYWSRASHRLSGLAAYVHKHVCRGTVTHAEYVTSGSTWPKGYHVPRGQLINWRTKHLPVPHSVFSLLLLCQLNGCIYLPVMRMPEQSPQFQFKLSPSLSHSLSPSIAMALASLLSHIGYLRTHTHLHPFWLCFASFRPNCQSKKCQRRSPPSTRKRFFRALTRPPSSPIPSMLLAATSLRMSLGNLDSCCSCCLQLA